MKVKCSLVSALTVCLIFLGSLAITALAEEVPRITKEKLKEMLDNPNVVIIDVRIGKDWKASDVKIKGAIRKDPEELSEWAGAFEKNKTYVLYCA